MARRAIARGLSSEFTAMTTAAQLRTFSSITRCLSAERMAAYRPGAAGDEDALARYLWNTALCEALYPSLHFLEVGLRNVVFEAGANVYPASSVGCWLERPGILCEEERRLVRAAIKRLKRRGKPPETGRLIAELTFGFWTALFDVRYERSRMLWPRLFSQKIFSQAPRSQRSRKALSPLLNRVRHLRNRAFHHEPIWHWGDLAHQHVLVVDLLRWIAPELQATVASIDRFAHVHRKGVAPFRRRVNVLIAAPGRGCTPPSAASG